MLEGYEGKTIRNEPSARRFSHSTLVISTPHGAAAIARLLSPHRTALQPQRVCYLHTARRCSHSAFAISTPHGCKCSGERRNTRPLMGDANKAKSKEMEQMHGDKCTGASAAVRAETQGPLGERGIRQNKKKEFQDTGAISIPHGAAATARFLSQYRTALQPQRFCYLNTARVQGQR